MSLKKKYSVPYCPHCKALLIKFEDRVIQYVRQSRYFAEDGILEVQGDDQVDDTIPDEKYGCYCQVCGNSTHLYALISEELFKPILKFCYRVEEPCSIFEIDLKQNKNSLTRMNSPSAKQVQDAIFIRALAD